jgi:succinyl-CoA synthetase beta subunit
LFAELLEEMQHLSRARDIYSKLLEINPLHTKAHGRLAALQADEKFENSSSRIPHLFGRKN